MKDASESESVLRVCQEAPAGGKLPGEAGENKAQGPGVRAGLCSLVPGSG